MNVIQFSDVRVRVGDREVLAGVSFDIAAGEFIGLLGPNGSGKTTLMRAILGLLRASGEVRVLGKTPMRGNSAIGYLPQARSAGDLRLSGEAFLAAAVNGHRLGLPFAGRAVRMEVERVLDLVGARELGRRPLSEISGGERQRLLLAQALVGRPRLLLLDEPLVNLDPNFQAGVVALAASLRAELGITVLFSAHELNPLLGTLDRVLYLGRGQAAIGSVDDVITGPVLSRLYGTEIDVVRLQGRIFVMAGRQDVEHDVHRHDDGHDHGPAHALFGAADGDA